MRRKTVSRSKEYRASYRTMVKMKKQIKALSRKINRAIKKKYR